MSTFSAVDGGWSLWTPYSDCSRTCGVGSQERTRECNAPAPENGGKDCEGESRERKTCSEAPCESKLEIIITTIHFLKVKL